MNNNAILIKLVILASVILFSKFAEGSNYYFSSSIGDDSRTSVQARNPATPWKTITRLNSYFASLSAGDSVLFKTGDVFTGTITPTISGTSAKPIIISSYGQGPKPIISGFQTITGWTNEGNGIYSKTVTGESIPNMVTVNGVNTAKGRYPNANGSKGGYLTINSHTGNYSLTGDGINSATIDWTGAEVVLKTWHWVIDRGTITAHSGSTLTYTGGVSEVKNGYGFFIQNDIRTFDIVGEWAYRSGKLYMYFGTNNPANFTVKVSVLDKGFYESGKNYLTLKNLSFEGANVYGLHLNAGSHIDILDCNIDFIGATGVYNPSSTYTTINRSWLTNINDNAVLGNSSSTNGYVGYSTIRNCIMIPGATASGDGHGFGLSLQGDNSITEYNNISNMGYLGCLMGGNNTKIRNNVIDRTNLIKDDGGSIYVSGALTTEMYGRIIENNIVTSAIGNGDGTNSKVSEAYGIYADGTANHVIIRNNTVTKCTNAGIVMGWYTHHIDILNNTLIDNTTNFFVIEGNETPNNMTINGNVFATTSSNDLVRLTMGSMKLSSLGTWAGNYYIKPFGANTVLTLNYTSPKPIYDAYSIDGFRAFDATAHTTPITITPFTINSLIGTNKFSNGNFNSNIIGTSFYYSGTGTASWDNTNKINGVSLKLDYTVLSNSNTFWQASAARVTFDVGSVTANTKYILTFDVLGSLPNKSVEVFLRSGQVYATSWFTYYSYTNNTTTVRVLLEPNVSQSSSFVYLQFRDEDLPVYIDNVTFYEANVTKANPDHYIRFEYNDTQSTKKIVLDGTYLGVDSTIYSGSISLLPYTSVVLFKNEVISANHIPTIQNQNFQLNENKPNGSVVGSVIATDPDAGQTLSYSILSGNTNGAFAINASTGVLTVANSSAINVEVTPSFALVVKVEDNGTGNLSSQAIITINILSTGIELNETNQKIKVYPNPVSDELNIEIEWNTDSLGFEILNSIGQLVIKGKLTDKTVVKTTNFNPGIYFIKIENGGTFEFRKIVKD